MADRLSRQVLLNRNCPPRFRFFIHETALIIPVGGAEVMSEQLHQLLRWSVRPHVCIRVVPIALGAHSAMSGAFRLMEVRGFKPVVYLESENVGMFQQTPPEIAAYRKILEALDGVALDRGQSRDLIADTATILYREEPDDPDSAGAMA